MPSTPDSDLLRAAAAGDAAGVSKALEAGASVEARDATHQTPLLLASLHNHLEAAKVLVDAGADPNAQDDILQSAWLVTGVTGSVEMLELLLTATPKPDLTLRNRYGGVSVIPASERGHVEYVRRVVTTGIDVNHVNDLGWTALLEAVILGDGGRRYQEIVRILLAAGATEIADKNGVRPLQHAARKGQRAIEGILQEWEDEHAPKQHQ